MSSKFPPNTDVIDVSIFSINVVFPLPEDPNIMILDGTLSVRSNNSCDVISLIYYTNNALIVSVEGLLL